MKVFSIFPAAKIPENSRFNSFSSAFEISELRQELVLPNFPKKIDNFNAKYHIQGQYYFIWPLKPDNKEQLYFAFREHGIWTGLTIIKKHGDCLEAFVFISPTMTDKIMDLYLNNKQVFELHNLAIFLF